MCAVFRFFALVTHVNDATRRVGELEDCSGICTLSGRFSATSEQA